MSNIFENYFNRPEKYLKGQIWHASEIGEDIVITEVIDFYQKMGIVRGMILSRDVHLDDGMDLKFKPTGELKKLFGLERILLRFTDGPVLTNDLSYYKGDIPAKISSKIEKVILNSPDLNPVQEEFAAKYLEKLQPLRHKVMARNEQYENEMLNMNKLKVLIILNELSKNAKRIKYGVAAADGKEAAKFVEFWKKERLSRENSIILMEDDNSILKLSGIDKRLYFIAKSIKFKKISDVKLIQKNSEIPAVNDILIFEKEDKVFTSFSDKKMLLKGDCTIVMKIDGKEFKFTFQIE